MSFRNVLVRSLDERLAHNRLGHFAHDRIHGGVRHGVLVFGAGREREGAQAQHGGCKEGKESLLHGDSFRQVLANYIVMNCIRSRYERISPLRIRNGRV